MKKLIYTIKNLSMMIGLLGIILAFIFNIYFPFKTNHGDNISVPNLIGMELNEINSFLYDRDLRYEILEDSSYSSEYSPFTVPSNPSPGSKVKEKQENIFNKCNSKVPPKIKDAKYYKRLC